jgi:hypothetical protein
MVGREGDRNEGDRQANQGRLPLESDANLALSRVISKCHVSGGRQHAVIMNTLFACLVVLTNPVLVVPPPSPASSVGRSAQTLLIMGSRHRPRRRPTGAADHAGYTSWVEVPASMGREVGWTLFDLNGREVLSGWTALSEAGPRRLSWERADVPTAGLYAVRCTDEHGQYFNAMVVILPN